MSNNLKLEIMTKIKKGAEICSMEDLLFPVEIRDEEMPCNKEYSKRVVGQLNGGDFLLNQCSDVYKLIENKEIFPKIEDVLNGAGIEYNVTYRHINHVRFYADFEITDTRFGYKMKDTMDVIRPMLRTQHSYNGLTKYGIVFGYFRLVCSNGLTIPVAEMKEYNLSIVGKHTEVIVKSFDELQNVLQRFVKEAATITNAIVSKYEVLRSRVRATEKDVENRITEIFEYMKMSLVDNAKFNTMNAIMMTIREEAGQMGYNGQFNDWLIYNAINQYLNDDSRNIATPEIRMAKDSKIFEYMLTYA
jgi:hypothetical protein